MNVYRTLNGEVFDLDELTKEEKAIYDKVKSFYDAAMEWTSFTNAWITGVRAILGDMPGSDLIEKPI